MFNMVFLLNDLTKKFQKNSFYYRNAPYFVPAAIFKNFFFLNSVAGRSYWNEGYLFRAFRTGTKSKILTFVNFFVFFDKFCTMVQKAKKLKK